MDLFGRSSVDHRSRPDIPGTQVNFCGCPLRFGDSARPSLGQTDSNPPDWSRETRMCERIWRGTVLPARLNHLDELSANLRIEHDRSCPAGHKERSGVIHPSARPLIRCKDRGHFARAPFYSALFACLDFRSTVSMARDSIPPEMVRALNPFCKRMRVA